MKGHRLVLHLQRENVAGWGCCFPGLVLSGNQMGHWMSSCGHPFPMLRLSVRFLTQSTSEASSHHDVMLCVQNTAGEKVNCSCLTRAAFVFRRSNSAKIIWGLKKNANAARCGWSQLLQSAGPFVFELGLYSQGTESELFGGQQAIVQDLGVIRETSPDLKVMVFYF